MATQCTLILLLSQSMVWRNVRFFILRHPYVGPSRLCHWRDHHDARETIVDARPRMPSKWVSAFVLMSQKVDVGLGLSLVKNLMSIRLCSR